MVRSGQKWSEMKVLDFSFPQEYLDQWLPAASLSRRPTLHVGGGEVVGWVVLVGGAREEW